MLKAFTRSGLLSPVLSVAFCMSFVLLLAQPACSASSTEISISTEIVDEVAQVLRQFRQETSVRIKINLIRQFGPIRDPRITVALMEVVLSAEEESGLLMIASATLVHFHIPEKEWV